MSNHHLFSFSGPALLIFGLYLAPLTAGAQAPAPVLAAKVPVAEVPDALDPGAKVLYASVVLKAGLSLSSQVQRLAEPMGWRVIWEAPDFMVEQSVTLNGDLFQITSAIVDSINVAGVSVKATFYKGNQILRIIGE